MKDLNERYFAAYASSCQSHPKNEGAAIEAVFQSQSKEVLCEFALIEALSPYGWHGDTSLTHVPTAAKDLADKMALGSHYTEMRSEARKYSNQIRAQFQQNLVDTLPEVTKSYLKLQRSRDSGQSPDQIRRNQIELETLFRQKLPYSTHPFFRDYYNSLLKRMELGGAHLTSDNEILRRVKKSLATSQSTFDLDVTSRIRASLESEAKTYLKVRQNQEASIGFPEAYKKSVGELGGFEANNNSVPAFNEAFRTLNQCYNRTSTQQNLAALEIADAGIQLVTIPGFSETYGAFSQGRELIKTYGECYPEIPSSYRKGVCQTLRAVPNANRKSWDLDFFGAAPDTIDCTLKLTVEAGLLVAAAVPIVNKAVVMVRVNRALRVKEKVGALSREASSLSKLEEAADGIGDVRRTGRTVSSRFRSGPYSDKELYQKAILAKGEMGPERVQELRQFIPRWAEFDDATRSFSKSKKLPDDTASLFDKLTETGGVQFEVELKYSMGSKKYGTMRGIPSELLDDGNGGWLVAFHGRSQKIPLKDIDASSIQIMKRGLPANVAKASKSSIAAREAGISSMFHNAGEDALNNTLKILEDGKLNSRAAVKTDGELRRGRHGVEYLAFRRDVDPPYKNTKVVIEFDVGVLDQKNYFVNPHMDWGYHTGQSIHYDDLENMKTFLNDRGIRGKGNHSEAVFFEPIPTTFVKRILMAPTDRIQMLKELERRRVKPPDGRTWLEIIQVFEKP